jgi:hypothetical protein
MISKERRAERAQKKESLYIYNAKGVGYYRIRLTGSQASDHANSEAGCGCLGIGLKILTI